jgi:two-component system response regulator DegU
MIVIAEDKAEVRRMIRKLIEDIDGDIVECSDGDEAIKAYETNQPDFVLLDINMQPLDGLTAAKEILSRHPEAKIIIVSQHQDDQTRETALSIGILAFVGKDDLTPLRDLIIKKSGQSFSGKR